jgi:hypothetical protein
MDAVADVNIQLGQTAEALQTLLRSTSIAPEANPYKWLNLAQLQSGLEATSSYAKGIELLSLKLTSSTDPEVTMHLLFLVANIPSMLL